MKACMICLSSSGMVHHGGLIVTESGPVASKIGGAMGLLVYMTRHGCLFACFPMVTVIFCCSGIFSVDGTTNLAAMSAKSLPLVFL